MTLTKSQDLFVRGAAPTLATGKKWKPAAAVAEAKAALRHRDIVGHVQHGRGGFGLGATTPTWQEATPNEWRHLVMEEMHHQEEAARCTRAVSQAQQVTNLRPDLVLWSNTWRRVFIVELTVPWEDAIDEAYERKKLRYANLAAEAEERGWDVKLRPVEVGCRGFVASSTTRLLKEGRPSGRQSKNLPLSPKGAVTGCG
ncbi:hypothetical protein SKAU_G00414440 [Synaphobranchus kaupii]|uniref:Uncharacterized protein n=1 Tax=Synaphobranchus kaupii TaxID=118154 RepID=A0A9Q1IBD9_SYNKA|nr:hypothetical protein SKAU_G00414440 [Synaphobranchus kaupii]